MSVETTTEPAPGLPVWPVEPESVDPTAATYLIIAIGTDPTTAEVARTWVSAAEHRAPTRLVVADGVDSDAAGHDPAGTGHVDIVTALQAARVGVRIMVVGRQYDVLTTLALARAQGAGEAELRCFVIDAEAPTVDLPVYCAHCRATHRMHTCPGGSAVCPGCGRRLEVHEHHSAARGSFLASDAEARDLP